MNMNPEEFKVVAHTLGMTDKKTLLADYTRNKYVAGDGHYNIKRLNALYKKGLMTKSSPVPMFDDDRVWTVTPHGIKKFEELFTKNKNQKIC